METLLESSVPGHDACRQSVNRAAVYQRYPRPKPRQSVALTALCWFVEKRAPMLARRLFRKKARVLLVTSASAEWREVKEIMSLAAKARPSVGFRNGPQRNNSQQISGDCRQTLMVGEQSANAKECCG